jgi:hypothetical protein
VRWRANSRCRPNWSRSTVTAGGCGSTANRCALPARATSCRRRWPKRWLEVVAGTPLDSPARREAVERERRQQEAERIIHNDPLVRELMGQFETARIVPGSIKPQ